MEGKILAGKRAIVTGASAGMGAAIALRYAEAGADIWAAGGSDAEGLKDTIDRCAALGVKAGGKGYDFTQAATASECVREGAEFMGGLDILVNCAGGRVFKPLAETSDEEIDFIFALNTRSIILACREAIRIMTPQGSGHIVNMGSIAGENASADRSLYCSTKAAVHSLTRCLAIELGPLGIQVNCLAPGIVNSGSVKKRLDANPDFAEMRRGQVPLGLIAGPETIAAAALFVVSPENNYMSGAIVALDGAAGA
ncbi:MAG: SDR family oxidoreductase [Nitrospinaceae bacterium]|nr:SDR family oxidoreductase [Nitrospinaceae bacterium]